MLKDYYSAETLLLQQIREIEIAWTEWRESPLGDEYLRVALMSERQGKVATADFPKGITLVLGEREA